MKSKLILFSVLLFCSKIVDSISHSEDHVRQRVYPPPNWQGNQNAPNEEYLDTDFTQTRNVNIQPEKAQDYYPNQGRRHNYDNNLYNRSPPSSPSEDDLLFSYGSSMGSYDSRVESYPSHTSQVEFDNHQPRNQNWRPQNHYTKQVPSSVLIPDHERPLVTTVQEPYRSPVQYLHPKYEPPTNQRYYHPGRSYLPREPVQYPLTGERKFVTNTAPLFGSSGSIPYENYAEDQAASDIKTRPTVSRYTHNIAPPSGIIYNEAPVVIAPDTLTDQSENIEFAENYRSRPFLRNSAPIRNHNLRSPLISEPDNNSDSIPSNLAHINNKKETTVITNKILSQTPLARRYAHNYRPDSGWNNVVGDDSTNGGPVVNEPAEVKSENYEINYRPREHVPIQTQSGAPSTPSGKRKESNVPLQAPTPIPTPTNTNPKQNAYPTISSEGIITEYNLSSFVAKPEVQDMLARTNKRYVVVHSNGTVEFLDTIDFNSPQNSKFRLVNHKRKNIGDSDSDRFLTQNSPENLRNNIAKTPFSVGEYPSPTNNQPADDKKPKPLNVHQIDEYDSIRSPSFKPKKRPVDNINSKPLSPSTLNKDHSIQNEHVKPMPYDVNQPQNDGYSKTKIPPVNLSAAEGKSNPLLQDGNKFGDEKTQSAYDDNSKLHQIKDKNNLTPLLPNKRQTALFEKPKQSSVKHPENDYNSEPLLANEGQPHNEKPFHHYRRHPENYYKSKDSHINQPADNVNSSPSSLGERQPASDSNLRQLHEDQSGGESDSTLLPSHDKHLPHHYKLKSRNPHDQSSPGEDQIRNDNDSEPLSINPTQSANNTKSKPIHGIQSVNDNNSNPSSPDKNQPEEDKKSKPLRPNENQPTDDLKTKQNSKPLPSNAYASGDKTDSTSLPPHKKHPSHHYKQKSKNRHDQSPSGEGQTGDDNDSEPLPASLTQPENNTKSKPVHGVQSVNDNNSNPSSPDKNHPDEDKKSKPLRPNENQPTDDLKTKQNSKPLPINAYESGDKTDSTSLPPHKKHPSHHYKQKSKNPHDQSPPGEDQTGDDNDSEPLPASPTQPESNTKSKPVHGAQPGNDNNSNPSSPDKNQPEEDKKSKPLHPNKNQSQDDLNTKALSLKAYESVDKTDSTSLPPHKKNPSHHYKLKSKNPHDHSPPGEDQMEDDNDSEPLPASPTQPENNTKSKPVHGAQPGNDNNSNPSSPNKNQPEQDKKSKSSKRPNENQSTDDLKTKPTSADAFKNDDQNSFRTVSSTRPNYTTSSKPEVLKIHGRKHIHRTSTSTSPNVSTSATPGDTSEDQIVTLSPIEQTTDNVSDVPTEVTTHTSTSPTDNISDDKTKETKENKNTQTKDKTDVDQVKKPEEDTQTVSPSTSTLPSGNLSDDKTKGTKEKKDTQTKKKTNVDQVKKPKKDTHTAVCSSSELFDTNTDVPAESDDYFSVIVSPSVQIDVDTGDASGDNSLELEQSDTDITITVSNSTANDSEDEIITINVEISESTDDADTSSADNDLLITIDTNDGSNDNSKTLKPEDCKKDHNNNGKGQNVEIDLSNLKGEPTMWIRTTNQDFIDKLTAKDDTEYDLIYFFQIENQPVIEREKTTTIHCNGTVVTDIIEITYANKDDLTPTIAKTTKIMDLEDYKSSGQGIKEDEV